MLFIAGYVAGSKEIDELSFRQRVDENYKETYHLNDLLTEYHKKLWWYITQCDYMRQGLALSDLKLIRSISSWKKNCSSGWMKHSEHGKATSAVSKSG